VILCSKGYFNTRIKFYVLFTSAVVLINHIRLSSGTMFPPIALTFYLYNIVCLKCLIFRVHNCTWNSSWRISKKTYWYDSTRAEVCLRAAPISQSTGRSDWKRANSIPFPSTRTHAHIHTHWGCSGQYLAHITICIHASCTVLLGITPQN